MGRRPILWKRLLRRCAAAFLAALAALALLAHPLGQSIPGPLDPEKRIFRSRKWEQNGRVYTK